MKSSLLRLALAVCWVVGPAATATAAPVAVTYAFQTPWSISSAYAPGGGASTGQGTLTVVYASATLALGGAKTGPLHASLQMVATGAPVTFLGASVQGAQIGSIPLVDVLSTGVRVFTGPSALIQPVDPSLNITRGNLLTKAAGAATVQLFGSIQFTLVSGSFPGSLTGYLTLNGATAQEIARTAVPEPSKGALLASAAGMLGLAGARARRFRR